MNKTTIEHGYYTTDEVGRFHSFDDEPAIKVEDHIITEENGEIKEVSGYRAWYKNGQIHREGSPSVIRNSGEEYYYIDGKLQ